MMKRLSTGRKMEKLRSPNESDALLSGVSLAGFNATASAESSPQTQPPSELLQAAGGATPTAGGSRGRSNTGGGGVSMITPTKSASTSPAPTNDAGAAVTPPHGHGHGHVIDINRNAPTLLDAPHASNVRHHQRTASRTALPAPHQQSMLDSQGSAGGANYQSTGGESSASHRHHTLLASNPHAAHELDNSDALSTDNLANPNADPNAFLVLAPTFEDGSGMDAGREFTPDERCCCCKCALGRLASHCWFCVACLSFVLLSSLPRLLTIADGVVTLLLYLSSGVRDSYPPDDDGGFGPPDHHGETQYRSIPTFLDYDFANYKFERSAADVVLFALIRMFALFYVYSYRFHTHPYTLKTSFAVMIFSAVYTAAKLGTNTHRALLVLLWYSFGICIGEYVLFLLVRRRRIRAPLGPTVTGSSPTASLTSRPGTTGVGTTPGQRYTPLDGEDRFASTPSVGTIGGGGFGDKPPSSGDYSALPPADSAAVVHRIHVKEASRPLTAASVAAIPDGVDPSALADADSKFMFIDGLRVHYRLFRAPPPPAPVVASPAPAPSLSAGAPDFDSNSASATVSSTTGATVAVGTPTTAPTKSAADKLAAMFASATRYSEDSSAATAAADAGGSFATPVKTKQLQQRTSSSGSDGKVDGGASSGQPAAAGPARIDTPLVLLHGFGGSIFSWRRVWRTLCANAEVVLAFDRPGFGLTSRPLNDGSRQWIEPSAFRGAGSSAAAATAAVDPSAHGPGAPSDAPSPELFSYLLNSPTCELNPYSQDYAVWLLFRLLAALNLTNTILIGHSTGGALAVRAAAVQAAAASSAAAVATAADEKAPPPIVTAERIRALCIVSPTIYSGGFPDFIRSMFRTSLGKGIVQQLVRSELGEVTIRRAWHDPTRIPEDVMLNYKRTAKVLHYHEALIEMAGVDDRKSHRLSKLLGRVKAPVCILHGEDDRLVACSESSKTITKLTSANADLVVIPSGGHVPHEEFPDVFLVQLFTFLRRMEQQSTQPLPPLTPSAKFNTL